MTTAQAPPLTEDTPVVAPGPKFADSCNRRALLSYVQRVFTRHSGGRDKLGVPELPERYGVVALRQLRKSSPNREKLLREQVRDLREEVENTESLRR